jgi:hypothetical protein
MSFETHLPAMFQDLNGAEKEAVLDLLEQRPDLLDKRSAAPNNTSLSF